MAVYDDPYFVKALKLLHSPAKDSATQIMHLLEEAIDQKYGGTKRLDLKLHNILEETSMTLDHPKTRGSRGPSPVLLGISEKTSRSSTPPSEPVSIRTSPDRDDGDLALEIFEDDLFCTVCKGIRVTSDNRLLECNDCHSLYHQECHKPPIDNDANDPRLIWSCGDCTKINQEKIEKTKAKSSEPSPSKNKPDTDHTEPSSKKQKTEVDSTTSEPPTKKHKLDSEKSDGRSSHKRSDKSEKSHSSKSSHSSSKASVSGSSSSSSSRSESRSSKSSGSTLNFNKRPASPNGKTPSCTANIIAADRRLQHMKKKAAAKMQEKRCNPK